ncbi:MAG: flagellar brake protein [Rhodocyclaceae bacterium]|nr:flagellar brake protein [Rhodocyclaceae bacterium]
MSWIPVGREDLPLGMPLPWSLFDRDGRELMSRGVVVEDGPVLQALLDSGPLRELSWPGEATDVEPEPESAELADAGRRLDAAMQERSGRDFAFGDMRLRVGDRIQLQPPATVSQERYLVRLIGYLDQSSLLVTLPKSNGLRVPLRENDTVVARVFSSQNAFGFSSRIDRICKIPYDYMHLSFPKEIQGAIVRKAPRVRTRIIASIAASERVDEKARQSGVIVNLSADGALIQARQALGEKGQAIRLSFRVSLHNIDALLNVQAVLRNVFDDDSGPRSGAMVSHGVQFQEVSANDSVILQSLIYQQMIEQPHTLA